MDQDASRKDLLRQTLELLRKKGVDYADIRLVGTLRETISVKNRQVEATGFSDEEGAGVRVLADGAWGFAADSRLTEKSLAAAAEDAIRIARASATAKRADVILAEVEPAVAQYESPYQQDPFEVSLDDKLALLFSATELLGDDPRIVVAAGYMDFMKKRQVFASTEGAWIEQRILHSGTGISAVAREGDEVQRRSYPNVFGGDFVSGGYEFVLEQDLAGNAQRIREEAVALLTAPACPHQKTDLILHGDQLALQVHESCGHPIELDRVMGTEISLAGGSFLTTDKLGGYRYGSPAVNITADATIPGALGSFGFDDEGVPAQRTPIVREGIFVGYLTSRETAPAISQRSNGTMRADGWGRIPLIRMTNINLEPGQGSLEDLIADTDHGILMQSNKSWSIDDLRLNFQFGCEIAWEIKGGRLGSILKNPVYTGITPQFWASCDAVCGPEHWRVWGVPNCGKGEPMQTARVAHGTSPARFRNVQVGVKK